MRDAGNGGEGMIWEALAVLDLFVLAATLVYLVVRIEQEVQRERQNDKAQ